MRKNFWLIPVLLIIIGVMFLLFVGLGFGFMTFGMPMMMPMMMDRGYSYVIFRIFFIFVVVILLILATYFLMHRKKRKLHNCDHCGRKVESEWEICPYCGHPLS